MSADVFVVTTERALGLLSDARRAAAEHTPAPGIREVAEEVCRAIGAVCDARDARRDPLAALETAQARVTLACVHLGAPSGFAPLLTETLAELMTASRFAPPFAPQHATRARMSDGVPHPAWRERETAVPQPRALALPPHAVPPLESAQESGADRVTAILDRLARKRAPLPAEPATDESMEPPDLPEGAAEDAERSLEAGEPVDPLLPLEDDAAFNVRWVRDLFDEVAALGMQRMPLKDDDVWGRAFVEDRLLAALDALIGLGDAALLRLEELCADAPAPDPWHLFTLGLVAGTVGGRDLAFLLESTLRDQDIEDEDVAIAWEAAHRLVCSPAMRTMLRSLLQSNSSTLRMFGLRGLAASDSATTEELLELARGEDLGLLGIALRALGRRRVSHAVPIALAALARAAPDAPIHLTCCRTLLVLRTPVLAEVLRTALRQDACDWAGIIAGISGDAELASELQVVTRAAPTVGRALGLGWAGRVDALALLLTLLDLEEVEIAVAAARSLARMLGEAPIEERDVDPETLADPDLDDPAVVTQLDPPKSRPHHADQGDQPEGSPDRVSAFSRDRALWEPLVEKARSTLPRGVRVRHGLAYSPHRSLAELLQRDVPVPSTPDERHWAYEELLTHSEVALPFDPETWISVQAEQLESIRLALGAE